MCWKLFLLTSLILVLTVSGSAVQAGFGLVENFDSMSTTGSPDGAACTGVMGGIWDTESDGTGNITITDNSGSRVVTVIGNSGGSTRGIGFNGITNPIDNSETGIAFFRFILRTGSLQPRTYIGLISDTSDNPINSTSAGTPANIPAGFGLLDNSSGGLNLVKTDGTTVLKPNVVRGQWYNFWIVADNSADTFDLYLSEAEGPAGEATLPRPEDLVESNIPFSVVTTEPLTGMIFTNPAGTVQAERIYVDEIWWDGDQGLEKPKKARNPSPASGATDVSRDVVLSWTPGPFAVTHDVYFGTSFDEVGSANTGSPLLVSRAQTANTYVPGRLEFNRTYYWRIDEVNGPPALTVHKGDVWQFTTETLSYVIENVTATASSSAVAKGPENAVNSSGLDSSGLLHGNTGDNTMWLSDVAGPQPTWIEFDLGEVHKLYEMWVWNSNESLEAVIGLGCKDVTIEYSVDGINYSTLGTTHEFARAPGTPDYAHNTIIDMSSVAAKYIRLTANSNWGGLLPQFGLSEVSFFSIPVHAREPSPASGATDVELDLILGFRAGREAARHDVYFSEDRQAVIDGTASVTSVTDATYGPVALDLGKVYYWRVDEVNDTEIPSTWQGDVWHFTTQESFVLDDFESYDDIEPNTIFNTWLDGYSDPANGSEVANEYPPYAEQTNVHGGNQSMPYSFDNSVGISEASMTLSFHRDWTARGIGTLALWFRGYPASVGSFLEGPAGTYTMTATGADIYGTADEFHFAYRQLSGVGSIVARVESVELTDDWAKCGVMIRETLDAGSKFAAVYIMPTNDDGTPTNGCRFQARIETDGDASSDTSVATDEQKAIIAPYWVKLERDAGGNFRGYYSIDGAAWQSMAWNARNIQMQSDVYIGLALTSGNNNAVCQAGFSNVQTTGNVTGQWQSQDVGISSNAAEPMYVAVANRTGAPAVVYHEDPAAAQIDTWTQWPIDIKKFSDQGINLSDVDKLYIGFGNRSNPQAGGKGMVYIDDIGLYSEIKPPEQLWFEAESADIIGASWRNYDDPNASGGKHIGSEDGDGSDGTYAPGAEWLAGYNFNAAGGVYKVVLRGQEAGADSFWVRIVGAVSQNFENPDQPGTGWVKFNGMDAPAGWAWDEVHSDDASGDPVVNWTLASGQYTLEIGKREDGTYLDAILVTSYLDIDQATLPDAIPPATGP